MATYQRTVKLSTFRKLHMHFARTKLHKGQWVQVDGTKWQVHSHGALGVQLRRVHTRQWLKLTRRYCDTSKFLYVYCAPVYLLDIFIANHREACNVAMALVYCFHIALTLAYAAIALG